MWTNKITFLFNPNGCFSYLWNIIKFIIRIKRFLIACLYHEFMMNAETWTFRYTATRPTRPRLIGWSNVFGGIVQFWEFHALIYVRYHLAFLWNTVHEMWSLLLLVFFSKFFIFVVVSYILLLFWWLENLNLLLVSYQSIVTLIFYLTKLANQSCVMCEVALTLLFVCVFFFFFKLSYDICILYFHYFFFLLLLLIF